MSLSTLPLSPAANLSAQTRVMAIGRELNRSNIDYWHKVASDGYFGSMGAGVRGDRDAWRAAVEQTRGMLTKGGKLDLGPALASLVAEFDDLEAPAVVVIRGLSGEIVYDACRAWIRAELATMSFAERWALANTVNMPTDRDALEDAAFWACVDEVDEVTGELEDGREASDACGDGLRDIDDPAVSNRIWRERLEAYARTAGLL